MDVEKIIDLLREALEEKDWELIKELIDTLLYESDNPFDDYKKDEDLDEDDW